VAAGPSFRPDGLQRLPVGKETPARNTGTISERTNRGMIVRRVARGGSE
jgi:hypothetical protein